MAIIGTLVAKLAMDNGNFKRGAKDARSELRSLANAGSAAAATGFIASLGFGVKLAAEAEQASVAFKTLLGSADDAKQVLDDVQQFAASTPFQTDELRNAARNLAAFGFEAQEIVPNLRRLGDIAAGTNQPIGELSEIFGKAKVQGRLFMEDINQLTGRGIPIIGALAKQFGVAEAEVRSLVEQGEVGFGNLQQAVMDMTSEGGKFGGMMEAQSKTAMGLYSTIKDNVAVALREVGEVILPTVSGGLQNLARNAESIGPAVKTAIAFAGAVTAVKVATIAWATATRVATAAGILFQAVMNPASLAKIAVGLAAGAALIVAMNNELDAATDTATEAKAELEEVTKEAEAVAEAGTAAAKSLSEFERLPDAIKPAVAELQKWNEDFQKYREMGAQRAVEGTQHFAGKIAEDVLALVDFQDEATQTEKDLAGLKGALEQIQSIDPELIGRETANELTTRITDQIAELSGVGEAIAGAQRDLQLATGELTDIDVAVQDALAAGALPEQVAELRRAMEDLAAAESTNEPKSHMQSMRDEIDLLTGDITEAELALRKFAESGAPAELVDEFRQLSKEMEQAKLLSKGEALAKEFRTPAEEFRDQIDELVELYRGGAIDRNTFARALHDGKQRFQSEGSIGKAPNLSVGEAGSKEAADAIIAASRKDGAIPIQERQAALLDEANQLLQAIRDGVNKETEQSVYRI